MVPVNSLLTAREPWDNKYAIRCLLAGYIDGEFGIVEISDNGTSSTYWKQGFQALGSGAKAAEIAWQALDRSQLEPFVRLSRVMEAITDYDLWSRGPVDAYRITSTGVEKIELEIRHAGN